MKLSFNDMQNLVSIYIYQSTLRPRVSTSSGMYSRTTHHKPLMTLRGFADTSLRYTCNEYNYKGADSAFIFARSLLVTSQCSCTGSTLTLLGYYQGTAQHGQGYIPMGGDMLDYRYKR